MKHILLPVLLIFWIIPGLAKEYHVAKSGINKNPATKELPLLTIQAMFI